MHCPESDSLLFIGSPFIDGLEGLTGSGLFISDIPLHDATRDVILVGEQARAQVNNVKRFTFQLQRAFKQNVLLLLGGNM